MPRPPLRPAGESQTATLVRGAKMPEPLGVIVRVLDGRATPATLRLAQGRCTIGSAEGCDLVISETTVSRAGTPRHY